MSRRTQTTLFAAIAALGAALIFIGFMQHVVLQVKVLHLATYLIVIGAALCCAGIAGLGVLIVIPPRPDQ